MKTIKILAIALVAAFSVSIANAQTPVKAQKPAQTTKAEKKAAKAEKKTDSAATKKVHTKGKKGVK